MHDRLTYLDHLSKEHVDISTCVRDGGSFGNTPLGMQNPRGRSSIYARM